MQLGAAVGAPGLSVRAAAFCERSVSLDLRDKAIIILGRLAEPDEVAAAVEFIFENEFFTGRVLALDGGMRS